MDHFSQYGHALVSVLIYALVAQVLNAVTGIRKGNENLQPGASFEQSYDNKSYRIDRAYLNTIEMLVFYAAIVFASVLAGANPFWINLLASAGLLCRLIANAVYIRGIGKAYGGVRTQLIIAASAANVGMIGFALVAIF